MTLIEEGLKPCPFTSPELQEERKLLNDCTSHGYECFHIPFVHPGFVSFALSNWRLDKLYQKPISLLKKSSTSSSVKRVTQPPHPFAQGFLVGLGLIIAFDLFHPPFSHSFWPFSTGWVVF